MKFLKAATLLAIASLIDTRLPHHLSATAYELIGDNDPGHCDTIGSTMDFFALTDAGFLMVGGTTTSDTWVRGVTSTACIPYPVPFVMR